MRIKNGQGVFEHIKFLQDDGTGVAPVSETIQLRKNGAYNPLSITISATSITGIRLTAYTPTVSDGFAAGDKIQTEGTANIVNSFGVTVTVPFKGESHIIDSYSVDDAISLVNGGVTTSALSSTALNSIEALSVSLATIQANYAPAKAGDAMAVSTTGINSISAVAFKLATIQDNYAPAKSGDAMAVSTTGLNSISALAFTLATVQANYAPAKASDITSALETAMQELADDPGATPTIKTALMLLYMHLRNEQVETATEQTIANNAGDAILTAPMNDDGTEFTKGKFV